MLRCAVTARKFFLRLAVVAGSICVAVAIAELLLRAFDYSPAVSSPLSSFHVSDDELGWVGIPNHKLRFKTLNFDVIVETDAHGFRGVVSNVEPDKDAPEVWVLGDSTVWGWGVGGGDLFVDHLQDLVGPSVRLRNFGINAYGTLQEHLLFERLLKFRPAPEKLVVMVCGNDFDDNVSHRDFRSPFLVPIEGSDRFEIGNLPVQRKIGGGASKLARRSRAISFISYCASLAKQLRKRDAIDDGLAGGVNQKAVRATRIPSARIGSPRREAMEYLLAGIAASCREHAVALDVIPFPAFGGANLRSVPSLTLEEICGKLDINFVELETAMAEGRVEYHFGRGDFHWNAEGNRRGAEVYFERAGPGLGVAE